MKRILSFFFGIAVVMGLLLMSPGAEPVNVAYAAEEVTACTGTGGCGSTNVVYTSEEKPTCAMPGQEAGYYCADCGRNIQGRAAIPATGDHELEHIDAKPATFTGIGYTEHDACKYCTYKSESYVKYEMLPTPAIDDYDTFLYYLGWLEQLANQYASEHPGEDPLALVIKYIRTGVDRYNSGSWGIMAGYEDKDFAEYVAVTEDMLNSQIGDPAQMLAITSLKDIKNFTLPNGDVVDFGHMFGTMDITYHNNFSVNHADVAGWAGDLVDLMEFVDVDSHNKGISLDDMTVDKLVEYVADNYFGQTPSDPEQSAFNWKDIKGDLDGFYVTETLKAKEYVMGDLGGITDFETGALVTQGLMRPYFTEELTDEQRADYFLRNRLDGASTRSDVRDAVYKAFIGNKVVSTLEGTRVFNTTKMDNLRMACAYAFADYLCRTAGDFVEDHDITYINPYYSEKSILAPGVRQEIKYATTRDGKEVVYYLATADITRDDVNVYANYFDAYPEEGKYGMARVLEQAEAAQARFGDPESDEYIPNYSVIASTNGAGFNMSTGQPSGLLVMHGVLYSPINDSGFFGILKDGTAVIGTTEEYRTIYRDYVQEGIAGFGAMLVKDGEIAVADSDNYYDDRASRTAVGITKTGKVVLMVMDGRQESSRGGSMQEIAQVMLEAGCVDAVNLDGGGSTTYVAKPEGAEKLEVVNNPSDGIQRSVSTTLMIVSTAPDSKAFDHAAIDSPYIYMTIGSSMQMEAAGVSATGNSADIPEGAYWAVDDDRWGTITSDGVLTAHRLGDVTVQLKLGEDVIGEKTLKVITPQNIYFAKKNMDAVYGQSIILPLKALYQNKEVAFTADDITFELDRPDAGTMDGFEFTAAEATGIKNVKVTASITSEDTSVKTATITVSLYNQGENTFDFDRATGGDRQLAWDRKVDNATTDDEMYYTVVDNSEPMVTSYTLALDMTQIPIPAQLEELTFMLPGADMEGASAWMFLCALAERVSDLTTVTPVVTFDENLDVDVSELAVKNEYFTLTAKDFDEETNTVTLTLNWIKVGSPIELSEANPLCMVTGIKLTPKEDAAWDANKRLVITNEGEIGYDIYLRASSLVSFAAKPENQEAFGLYPYDNTENRAKDEGAHFMDTYKQFDDTYTLVNTARNGWVVQDAGFEYYVDGVKHTGVKEVDGLYYDFGEDGYNTGKTPYTGIFAMDDLNYYAKQGLLQKESWPVIENVYYHTDANGAIHEAEFTDPVTCVKGGKQKYYCETCDVTHYSVFQFPQGHDWNTLKNPYECHICGTVGKEIKGKSNGAPSLDGTPVINFGTISNPRTSTGIPRYELVPGGIRPSTYVTFDGVNALSYSNDNNVNDDGTMKDMYIKWENDRGIGVAYTHYEGRGDYYGSAKLQYVLIPQKVNNLRVASATDTTITLEWDESYGADYYRLYSCPENKNANRTLVANVEGATTYTVTGLEPNTEYYFIAANSAYSDNPTDLDANKNPKVYNCASWSNLLAAKTTLIPSENGMVEGARISVGGSAVDMQYVDGTPYIFLPADADITNMSLHVMLNEAAAGAEVNVIGDKKSVYGQAIGGDCVIKINLADMATKLDNGSYVLTMGAGAYTGMAVNIMQADAIPSMFIISDDPEKGRANYVDLSKSNEATAQMTLTEADGTIVYGGALTQVKARGNSTFAHYPKKAYQIKLENKVDLIGQNQESKTWVLLANYGDATMMHDKFFKDIAAEMDMPYVAGCDWVNLWYDGEYRGVYLLSEKNSVGSTSVDITDMEDAYAEANPTYGEDMTTAEGTNKYGCDYAYTEGLTGPSDITGGYLIEINHQTWDEVNGFETKMGKGVNVKSPEWASEEAMQYISEYYQEFEDAVYAVDKDGNYTGYNKDTGKYFYDYVDMDSLVKVFLIQELGLNPDGFISSLYFYKDVDGKMYAGPIWDQDMTLGTGWTKYIDSEIIDYHYLAEALIQIPEFKAAVVEYFNEEFAPMIENALSDGEIIENYYTKLAVNAKMNYILWDYIRVGDPANANHIWTDAEYDDVVADMEEWMSDRLALLEGIFVPEEPEYEPGDADGSGVADSSDVVLILQFLAGHTLDNFNELAADFNGDGSADTTDAVIILRRLAGLE